MNYQVAPFWINSGKLACLIVISLFLAFFSVSTFIAYLLVIGVGMGSIGIVQNTCNERKGSNTKKQ
ncbi:hypothetical protein M0H77_RS13250 [Providencia rettgeri]|nr:hypothetical protein [Providencia rettgeri]EJD6583585.1 hypothetical protein [Providencia rettgeri]